jgi:hypothetical protein
MRVTLRFSQAGRDRLDVRNFEQLKLETYIEDDCQENIPQTETSKKDAQPSQPVIRRRMNLPGQYNQVYANGGEQHQEVSNPWLGDHLGPSVLKHDMPPPLFSL